MSASDEIKKNPVLLYDVLESIFKSLNIFDLLQVADSDTSLVQPAVWAFQQSHAHKVIKFNGTLYQVPGEPFVESSDMIYIRDYRLMKRIIKTFGSSILKFNIGYDYFTASVITELNSLIVEKCANKLQYLDISFENTELDSVLPAVIFPNVETLIFRMMGQIDNSIIDLNERFPQLRSLNLGIFSATNDTTLFDRHFPHLKHMGFYYMLFDDHNDTKIQNVFQKNVQLKSISVLQNSLNNLRIVHENYPNLEELQMRDIPTWFAEPMHGIYHFNNVRKFHLHLNYENPLIPLTFGDQLNEVIVETAWTVDHHWSRFIGDIPSVEKLIVNFRYEKHTSYAYLTYASFKNLKELELHGFDLTANDELDAFLDGIKRWTNLELICFVEQPKNSTDVLKDKFSPEWEMRAFEHAGSDGMIDIVFAKN